MKTIRLVVFSFILFIITGANNSVYSQAPDIDWTQTLGGTAFENAFTVKQTSDGGYIVSGYTNSFGNGDNDVYLVKTDANGEVLWSATYGGANEDRGYSVLETTDGGFIIAGRTESFGSGFSDAYLIKTDDHGNEQWSYTYGGTGYDLGKMVIQTNDGGYAMAGKTYSWGAGISDFYLIKVDANGTEQWTKTYGGSSSEDCKSIQQTADGGYILGGDTDSYGNGNYSLYMVKTDADGNEEWSQYYGTTSIDYGNHAIETSAGQFIIVGQTWSLYAGQGYDIILIKTDSQGNQLWLKMFTGYTSDLGECVIESTDNGLLISGTREDPFETHADFYFLKTTKDGDSLWSITTGGVNKDWGRKAHQCSDGGYIMTGRTESYGAGDSDIWLVKTEADAVGIEHNILSETYALHQNFPNPINASTVITYSVSHSAYINITVYDVYGRLVETIVNEQMPNGNNSVEFDGTALPCGIYLYVLKADNQLVGKKKMVISH